VYNQNTKILILHFGTLQQSLTLTPLLKILKEQMNLSISVITPNINFETLKNNPHIDELLIAESGIKLFVKNILTLRKRKFDIIIDTHERMNKLSSIILALVKTEYKIGFKKEDYRILSHGAIRLDSNKIHIVDRLLSLLDIFEYEYNKTDLNIIYNTSPDSKKTIENYFIKHDLSYKLTSVINISNERSIGFWGLDSYSSLLKYLENYDINIILASSIDDLEIAEKISNNKYLIFYDTDFDVYAELINQANFIFSPDSYSIQLAASFNIPVFCLFVQHKTAEMINVPYNSDFDFALTEKSKLNDISFGKVLNSFVPYFEYVYEKYNSKK